MGIHKAELYDPNPTSWMDLSGQFYLKEEDIGHPRAERCLPYIRALNQYVEVRLCPEAEVDAACVSRFDALVVTDAPALEMLRLGDLARAAGKKFVCAEGRGGFGRVFSDMGPAHVVDDVNGEAPVVGVVALITNDEAGSVSVSEDTGRHGLSVGDYVKFSELRGMTQLNDGTPRLVTRVLSPTTFCIGDTRGLAEYAGGGMYTSVKMPVTVAFSPLSSMLGPVGAPHHGPPDESHFSITDYAKLDRTSLLHAAFFALHSSPPKTPPSTTKAFGMGGEVILGPSLGDEGAVVELVEETERLLKAHSQDLTTKLSPAQRALVTQFARGAQGTFSPMCGALGGIAGQEVIKGLTSKFMPIRQWLYLDCSEALPPGDTPPLPLHEVAPRGDRYDAQCAVFGRTVQQRLGSLKYFLVGAGAIGCELLKTWALMGVAAGPSGKCIVTDMDRIERSNLSRQFLFRNSHIGRPKSSTALSAVEAMNSSFRGAAYEIRLGEESEGTFNDAFWDSLDGVATALDNVDARLYVDRCCLKYGKPMLDSGTLGTMGSTQVILPHLSENYGATRDPPEKGIPVCVLKDFPYMIEHTLAWAKDWFEGEFKQLPETINAFLSKPDFLTELANQTNSQLETLQKVSFFRVVLFLFLPPHSHAGTKLSFFHTPITVIRCPREGKASHHGGLCVLVCLTLH